MDRRTRQIYEANAEQWIRERRPDALEDGRFATLTERLTAGARVADLGCGPAWYARALAAAGLRPVALDVSLAMLRAAAREAPRIAATCADLARLPFGRETLDGALAWKAYCHLPGDELPAALAQLHATLRPGAPVALSLVDLAQRDPDIRAGQKDIRLGRGELAGRLFSAWSAERARRLFEGAGFADVELETSEFWLELSATRGRTLPDFVRGGLLALFVGLNPSLYAADRGVPFARPGNRFWPALARGAGYGGGPDPFVALDAGFGFSDWVKRATPRASALDPAEFAAGRARIEALVRDYAPRVVCFVGLAGYRDAVDPGARAGWIGGGFGGRPAYLMPSTSGLNAHSTPAQFAEHVARALDDPPPEAAPRSEAERC